VAWPAPFSGGGFFLVLLLDWLILALYLLCLQVFCDYRARKHIVQI
jgi:hypothetical protein